MWPFIIFYLIVFILSFKIKTQKYNFFDFILLFVIIFFSAIRSVGVDYELYKNFFSWMSPNMLISSRTGIGYTFFAYFVKYIMHQDYQLIIAVISFFTNFFIYTYIKKYSKNPGLAILSYISLGFYTTSFNMFRQMLSLSFVLIGIKRLDEKKIISFIIFCILAFLMHSSAIIAILVYICFFIKKDFKLNNYLVFFISFILLLLYDHYFTIFISIFDAYSLYANYNSSQGIGTFLNVSMYLIIFIIFTVLKKKYLNAKEDNYIFNLYTIGVAIMVLEFKNSLFFRIAFYFCVNFPIIIANLYSSISAKNKKVLNLILYTCLFIYFIFYVSSVDGVMPYSTIFSG